MVWVGGGIILHGLEGYGLEIVDRVPLQSVPNPENIRYLTTKKEKLGHLLDSLAEAGLSEEEIR